MTLGLSQADLAARVGVSRQALTAIEAGRQVPSTLLALQLARALGSTVDGLFRLSGPSTIEARTPGGPIARAVVGQIDGAWVAHPAVDESQAADAIAVGPATADEVMIALEPLGDLSALASNVLVCGCAPLLGLLAGRVGRRYGDASASWIPASSGRSLKLLERGLVHAAGVHLVDADTPGGHAALVQDRFTQQSMVIVNLTRWRQGLVTARNNPKGIVEVQDVVRSDVRAAGRENGSGAEQLLARTLGDDYARFCPVVVASGHLEVARMVRWGVVDTGVSIEAAARAEGLAFIPLAEERFDLLVPRSRAQVAPVARLLDQLEQPAFRADAGRLPGYDLSMTGHAAVVEGHR